MAPHFDHNYKPEKELMPFPSIELTRKVFPKIIKDAQFTHYDRKWGKACYNKNASLPQLEFRGTVKLHGQNTAIVLTFPGGNDGIVKGKSKGGLHFQSRQRILTAQQDLNGFHAHMSEHIPTIDSILRYIRTCLEHSVTNKQLARIAIFGEWCGASIQKGVALSQLEKMFVVFAIKVEYYDQPGKLTSPADSGTPAAWLDISSEATMAAITDEKARIFNVFQFGTRSVAVDFNNEESVEAGLNRVDALTQEVEDRCPAAAFWGKHGVGEGLVWQVVRALPPLAHKCDHYTQSAFWFKSKGSQHAQFGQKVSKTPAALIGDIAKKARIERFLKVAVTPGRLEQALQYIERERMLELEKNSFSAFLRWINDDIWKEENDRMETAGLEASDLEQPIHVKAMAWFTERLEREKMKLGREKLLQRLGQHKVEKSDEKAGRMGI